MPDDKATRCPSCGEGLRDISAGHYHCNCGVCLYKGMQLTWHRRHSEVEEYCLGDWKKDIYIKTSGLA
jgi:hypothetical protein